MMTAPFNIDRLTTIGSEPANEKNNFDLLRLVGALLVVVGHIEYPYFGHNPDWAGWLTQHQSGGGFGVGIFFVISGFLIAQSRWRSSLRRYTLNRFLRIFPALAVCILVTAIVVWPVSGLSLAKYFFSKAMVGFLLNALVLPINACTAPIGVGYVYGCSLAGGTWSLTFELMMYVFIGLIGFLANRTQIALMVILLCAILIPIAHDSLYPLGNWTIDVNGINLFLFIPHRGMPFVCLFLMGSLLNFVPRTLLMSPLTFWASLILFVGTFRTNTPLFLLTQTLVMPFIVLWLGLRHWKITDAYHRWVGDVSYGIFLYHWPVMTLTWIGLHDRLSVYPMTLIFAILTGGAAYTSRLLVETPALRLKHRRTKKIPGGVGVNPKPPVVAGGPPLGLGD